MNGFRVLHDALFIFKVLHNLVWNRCICIPSKMCSYVYLQMHEALCSGHNTQANTRPINIHTAEKPKTHKQTNRKFLARRCAHTNTSAHMFWFCQRGETKKHNSIYMWLMGGWVVVGREWIFYLKRYSTRAQTETGTSTKSGVEENQHSRCLHKTHARWTQAETGCTVLSPVHFNQFCVLCCRVLMWCDVYTLKWYGSYSHKLYHSSIIITLRLMRYPKLLCSKHKKNKSAHIITTEKLNDGITQRF